MSNHLMYTVWCSHWQTRSLELRNISWLDRFFLPIAITYSLWTQVVQIHMYFRFGHLDLTLPSPTIVSFCYQGARFFLQEANVSTLEVIFARCHHVRGLRSFHSMVFLFQGQRVILLCNWIKNESIKQISGLDEISSYTWNEMTMERNDCIPCGWGREKKHPLYYYIDMAWCQDLKLHFPTVWNKCCLP